MEVKFLKPRLGHLAGATAVIANVGVARTLISFGVCVEIKKDDDKLGDKKNVTSAEPASDTGGGKVASKTKRKRSNSRRKSDASN